MNEPDVLILGAGPAGLSAALALKDRGIRPLVLDKADDIASSWRGRYDRLRLNSCRHLSRLPDRRFARGTPLFPTRDDLIAHLKRHAREDEIELQLGTRVERIEPTDRGWALATSADRILAPQVVVATGFEGDPFVPEWGGRDRFEGRLLHSAEYRNPGPFARENVLVVGPGCSGVEIAYDLVEGGARKVWLSVRTPPNIMLRTGPVGIPGDVIGAALIRLPVRMGDAVADFGRVGDLSEYGLPDPSEGVFRRLYRTGQAPTIVDRDVIDAIKARRIEIVRGVESLDQTGVQLAGGARVEPDVVICATGYRRGLEALVGHLGVLDERGLPRAMAHTPAAPGLRFIGYVPRPGGLGYMSKEAKRAAKAIARELHGTSGKAPPPQPAVATR